VLGNTTAVTIIDPAGEVVWYHTEDRDLDFYRARLSLDGTSVLYNAASVSGDPAEDSELVRVALDGSGAHEVRGELPGTVRPGQRLETTLALRWPERPGRYRVTVDLVLEDVAWFADRLGEPLATSQVRRIAANERLHDGDRLLRRVFGFLELILDERQIGPIEPAHSEVAPHEPRRQREQQPHLGF